MKCPLFSIVDHETKGGKVTKLPDCLKEECAWWDRIQEKCGIVSFCHDIHWLVVAAQQIRDKMPTVL